MAFLIVLYTLYLELPARHEGRCRAAPGTGRARAAEETGLAQRSTPAPSPGAYRGMWPRRPRTSAATSGGAPVLEGAGQQHPAEHSQDRPGEPRKLGTGCLTAEEHSRGGASCHNGAVKVL